MLLLSTVMLANPFAMRFVHAQ